MRMALAQTNLTVADYARRANDSGAIGYCTLYGDMCGDLAVISDMPNELARTANQRHGGAISENHFTKLPSAEQRPDQKDRDPILRTCVQQYHSAQQAAPGLKFTTKPFGIGRRFSSQRFYE